MCPVCVEPMLGLELEGVEVDRCASCGGTWLDAGELEYLTEVAGASADRIAEILAGAIVGEWVKLRCPRCPRRLQQIRVGDPAVTLDRCSRGHGLWFDRGKMEQVIRSHAGGEDAVVARFFADLYHNEYSQP